VLSVIRPKGCKRCGGDLSLECDIYGVYIQCIQCGANWNENEVKLTAQDADKILKVVRARPAAIAARQK
jgi:hypothetical protein